MRWSWAILCNRALPCYFDWHSSKLNSMCCLPAQHINIFNNKIKYMLFVFLLAFSTDPLLYSLMLAFLVFLRFALFEWTFALNLTKILITHSCLDENYSILLDMNSALFYFCPCVMVYVLLRAQCQSSQWFPNPIVWGICNASAKSCTCFITWDAIMAVCQCVYIIWELR